MSKIVTSYDMFISSPGDVTEEIETIRKTIDKFNRTHRDSGTRILSARWDSDVFLPSGKPLQSSIDDMVASCDFLTAVFRTHIGTEIKPDPEKGTPGYPSGTAKEILNVLEAGKQVFVYLLDPESPPDASDRSYRRLLDFIDMLYSRDVLVTPYKNCKELASNFSDHLNLYYNSKLNKKETFCQAAQATQSLGITHMQIANADDSILREKIRSAKCVKILSTTGRAFLALHYSDLAEMLRHGGVLKLLLPNPGSDFLEDVNKIEKRDSEVNPIHREFSDTIGYLRDSLRLAENNGTIYVGCSYTLLRQTETICIDPEDRIWSWTTMTMPPLKASNQSLSLGAQADSTKEAASKTLAGLANTHFDKLWKFAEERSNVINFHDNPSLPYFYMERETAYKFWEEKLNDAKKAAYQARRHHGNRCLIEVAAQHPLTVDGTPDQEFAKRLDMGIALYHQFSAKDMDCYIYVPGSLHMHDGIIDKISLSAAGTAYLVQHGIPQDRIYGETENKKYKGQAGVYNSADECFVAARLWKDHGFGQMICVCSPQQTLRKAAHYIVSGVYPLIYAVPVQDPYHSYVEEMLHSLPDVLFRDPDCQSDRSAHAAHTRTERRPEI